MLGIHSLQGHDVMVNGQYEELNWQRKRKKNLVKFEKMLLVPSHHKYNMKNSWALSQKCLGNGFFLLPFHNCVSVSVPCQAISYRTVSGHSHYYRHRCPRPQTSYLHTGVYSTVDRYFKLILKQIVQKILSIRCVFLEQSNDLFEGHHSNNVQDAQFECLGTVTGTYPHLT